MTTISWTSSFKILAVASCLMFSLTLSAQGKGKGKGHDRDRDEYGPVVSTRAGMYFAPREVTVIHEYYAPQYRNLPPGLQKKLYRTGTLPPGWQKKLQPFPVVIERELAPVPVGYSRGFIDGYAVIYNPKTQVIIDVTAVFGR